MLRTRSPVFLIIFCRFVLAFEQKSDLQQITILNADRELDLSTQIIKETIKYEIQNADSRAVTYFLQMVDKKSAGNLSSIHASFNQEEVISKELIETDISSGRKDQVFYRVNFPKPMAAGSGIKFTVELQYTRMLRPFPTHILQKDQQFVQFHGNACVNSAYTVKKQTTVVNFHPGLQKVSPKYNPSNKMEILTVHYENNSPFLVVTKLTRLIELSHWGNIAVEENLEISHVGAILQGSFSRFDFQRDPRGKDKQPCIQSFKTILPASAKDVYYRDEIGNISTSRLKQKSDASELEIQPRFPLFGGWKTNYYIGYNVPSYEYLLSSGNRFGLKMRLIDHIYNNYVVDEITTKIILPEGAKDIELQTPYPVKRLPDEVHYTYLDFTGRPVVVLQKKNLVENHIKDFKESASESIRSKINTPAEQKSEPVVKKSGKKYQ